MSAVTHGADVGALRAWARAAADGAATLDDVATRLDRAVLTAPWSGPDRERFVADWQTRLAPSVRGASRALVAASDRAGLDAEEQELASTDGGTLGTSAAAAAHAAREAHEAGWARGAGRLLLGLVGHAVGGPVGALVGAVAGPRLVDGLVGVADDRADRTAVVDVTEEVPVRDTPPVGPADVLHDLADMYDHDGAVRVDLVTRPDGSQVALVLVPGTQDWSLDRDGANPMGAYGAVAAASGKDSPTRRLLLAALDEVPAGVPIHLATHSQSSFAALDVVADPYLRARHDIASVVTTGAGGGAFEVPPGTTVVSVRNPFDPVARIGGTPEGAIDVTGSWTGAHPHSSREYANLVGRSSSPELAAWWRGVGIEPGSTMTTRVLRGVVAPGD